MTQEPHPRTSPTYRRLPIAPPVLRTAVRISSTTGAEPLLSFDVRLGWKSQEWPPLLDRHGIIGLEDLASVDPPWCAAWEAIEQWRSAGYLWFPPGNDETPA